MRRWWRRGVTNQLSKGASVISKRQKRRTCFLQINWGHSMMLVTLSLEVERHARDSKVGGEPGPRISLGQVTS